MRYANKDDGQAVCGILFWDDKCCVFVFVLFCFDYCIIDADELTFQKHAVFVTPRLSSIQFQSFVGVKIILPFSTKRA